MKEVIRERSPTGALNSPELDGLEVRNLSKSFRTKSRRPIVAASQLSFDAPFGTVLALVGPSGCGKTTTLRALAGLETLDQGVIRLAGREITRCPPDRRDTAMVFQKPTALPHLSGRENLELALKFRKYSRAARKERVEELAERLALSEALDRKVGSISGGELQRVALGRALLTEPRAMLLDEPSHFLDPRNKHALWRWIREIVTWRNLAAVVVTHDPREALALGDRIAVMRQGEIVEIGDLTRIYQDPQSLEAASALTTGSLNTLSGVLDVGKRVGTFTSDSGAVVLNGDLNQSLNSQSIPALLAVRAEALHFAPQKDSVALDCELVDSRDLGFGSWNTLRVGAELWTAESSSPLAEFASFERVYAPPRDLMLFHRATGKRTPISWRSHD